MTKIILLILMFSYCSNPDDIFFFMNPNKSQIEKEERDKCRRSASIIYSAMLNIKDDELLNSGACANPNSVERKRDPDPLKCIETRKRNILIVFTYQYLICPKGLADD